MQVKRLVVYASLLLAEEQETEYLNGLYQNAIEAGEKEVVVFAPTVGLSRPLYAAFHERFPKLAVQNVAATGPALVVRMQAEQAAGKYSADVLSSTDADSLSMYRNGWLQAFFPKTAEGLAEKYHGKDGQWLAYSFSVGGVTVNNKVTAGERPKVWKDLVEERWRGQAAIETPGHLLGSTLRLLVAKRNGVIDDAWLEKFKDLSPGIYPTGTAVTNAVVSGQRSMNPTAGYQVFKGAKDRGAPVSFIFLQDGIPTLSNTIQIFKNAPNPNAAKLWMAWYFSREAQALNAKHVYLVGTMPFAPAVEGVPADGKLLESGWQMYETELEPWRKEFEDLFKR